MDFAYDGRTQEWRERLLAFMAEHVFPAEPVFAEQTAAAARSGFPWQRPPVVAELKAEARKRGLWNLFLANHPEGAGLTNLQYAPLAEITGHSPAIGHTPHAGLSDPGGIMLKSSYPPMSTPEGSHPTTAL